MASLTVGTSLMGVHTHDFRWPLQAMTPMVQCENQRLFKVPQR